MTKKTGAVVALLCSLAAACGLPPSEAEDGSEAPAAPRSSAATIGTSVVWTVQEGAAGGSISGTGLYAAPSTAGTYHLVATSVADGSKGATVTVTVRTAQQGPVQRPSYNTGTGFFVADGKLYDANGVEFIMRGVNKAHFDQAGTGIPRANANTIRMSTGLWRTASSLAASLQSMIDARIVPMPAVWYIDSSYADTSNVTCKSTTATFNTAVDMWVAQAATFKPFERWLLVNIANEWGPSNSTVWRDAYINAVGRLRAAGYLTTIVIDAGGCGQDPLDVINFARAVYDADPQHNVLFDVHIYGMWKNGNPASWQIDLNTGFDRLAAVGLPIVIGEFGPGRNIGPSPTMMTPGEIIQAANARGFGWLAWAWDDGNDDTWFALSRNGAYNSSADLTIFGRDVVETPAYGLLSTAQAATVFP